MAVTTASMFLTIPTVGTTVGPDYALNVNADLSLIDSHDHSLGRGVQIQPSGININTDFSMNSNDLTNVGGITFTALGSNPTTIQHLYVSPGVETPLTEDLWFNDGNGNQVQITNNGLVNATIASLPGQSYAAGTFFWKQGAGSTTPANFDIGSITIRPNVAATTFGVRLTPPAGITSQYDIALPLLPASQSIMTIDNSGTITTPDVWPITNSSIAVGTITGNRLVNQTITAAQIANDTITTTQISPTAGITGGQIATGTITQNNLEVKTVAPYALAGMVAQSAASGTFSNATTTYTQDTSAQTVTITVASPAVMAVASTTGYFIGMPVKFTTTGALPTGLTAGTYYFVSNVINATTFSVSAIPGGTSINTTGSQSGVHTATRITFSCTVTTLGSPVVIAMVPDSASTTCEFGIVNGSSTLSGVITASFKVTRNITTDVSTTTVSGSALNATGLSGVSGTVKVPPGSLYVIDTPAAGTYTYEIEIKTGTPTSTSAQVNNCKILAYEL